MIKRKVVEWVERYSDFKGYDLNKSRVAVGSAFMLSENEHS